MLKKNFARVFQCGSSERSFFSFLIRVWFLVLIFNCHLSSQGNSNSTRLDAGWRRPSAVSGHRNWAWSKAQPERQSFLTEKCGIRHHVRRRRIAGGRNARFGDWPWQVSVMQRKFFGFPNVHRCGGALLMHSWIVTSAHCVHRVVPVMLMVRLGEHDFSGTWEPKAFVERSVKRVVIHHKYDSITLENDVALLKFDSRVSFVNHIAPLCLPPTSSSLVGQTGVITGWGRLRENGALPPVLQEVSVRIISNERCESMFKNAGHTEHIPEIFVCTDYISRVPASHCQGDSGGPLQLKAPDGRWFLAGIISWGISCSEPDLPAVYVRISRYIDWMERVMS